MKQSLQHLFLILCVLFGCKAIAENTNTEKVLKFAIAKFSHETCTFCPGRDTEIEDWVKQREPYRGDDVLSSSVYIRGFVAATNEYDRIEMVGLQSPAGVYGDSSATWHSESTFQYFLAGMLKDLKAALPVDGVYLALHGAMAVRNIPRPEAEIARRFREVVGPDVPIVATFDLHGNEDEKFLEWADMAFATKRYPHYDARMQGVRAARYLIRMAKGSYRPTTATRKPPIITPTVLQWTGRSPSMEIMERARRWEARYPDVVVSVLFGFPWSDVPDVGATIHVMTHQDQPLANRIADDMFEYMWRRRAEFFSETLLKPDEAMRKTTETLSANNSPVVLADYSDRSGDATHILDSIIRHDLEGAIVATLRDEKVIAKLGQLNAKSGDDFAMKVGGFTGPASGNPVMVRGKLTYLGSGLGFEKLAVVSFGRGNTLVITPALKQIVLPETLKFGPLDPGDFRVFVLKSRVHFRRGFNETDYAKSIVLVDAPKKFIGTVHLDALPYRAIHLNDYYPYSELSRQSD